MQKCVSFDDDADNDAEAGGVPDNDEAPPVNRPRIPSVNKSIMDYYAERSVDANTVASVRQLCRKHNIDYQSVERMNLREFAFTFNVVEKSLKKRAVDSKFYLRIVPHSPPCPPDYPRFASFCRSMLLQYKPWAGTQESCWDSEPLPSEANDADSAQYQLVQNGLIIAMFTQLFNDSGSLFRSSMAPHFYRAVQLGMVHTPKVVVLRNLLFPCLPY